MDNTLSFNPLEDFPWEREGLWSAIWQVTMEKLGRNPDQDNEDIEEERLRARAAFDKAWEAFRPLLEPFNLSLTVENVNLPLSMADTVSAICRQCSVKTGQELKGRTYKSIDRVAAVIMQYQREIDELKTDRGK